MKNNKIKERVPFSFPTPRYDKHIIQEQILKYNVFFNLYVISSLCCYPVL